MKARMGFLTKRVAVGQGVIVPGKSYTRLMKKVSTKISRTITFICRQAITAREEIMGRIILACALAGLFPIPASALDGAPSPATVPPAIGVLPGDIPNTQYWHNPNLERAAKELLDQSRQLRRDAADLFAQATPGATASGPSVKTAFRHRLGSRNQT
jgi:hypothetical protein